MAHVLSRRAGCTFKSLYTFSLSLTSYPTSPRGEELSGSAKIGMRAAMAVGGPELSSN
ncbi:hypothetical protein Taro_035553, partial [Colocasia esculenta]|nr:hypothetical protein [Colocasia esculenta]